MMETVRAADVQPGDELYNGGKGAPCYWWVRVLSVKPLPDSMVEIETVSWLTRKHRAEAVGIRRPEPCAPFHATAAEVAEAYREYCATYDRAGYCDARR